jgi:hypothetical protein
MDPLDGLVPDPMNGAATIARRQSGATTSPPP